MAALDAAIHAFHRHFPWIRGTSPRMTVFLPLTLGPAYPLDGQDRAVFIENYTLPVG